MQRIPARHWFKGLPLLLGACSLLAGLALPLPAAGAEPARRPNLLFIVTDDQRWDALGVVQREQGERARFPWFTTPNLDRLAAEGVRFRNAFVVHSLCSPSRATFVSGQYGHRNGIKDNLTHFSAQAMNQARLLGAAGYHTAYIGKFHMSSQPERPGFNSIASYTGQGLYEGSTFLVNGAPKRPAGWVDDIATDFALQFIRTNQAQPWMMMLGYKAAHTPRQPPEGPAVVSPAAQSNRRAMPRPLPLMAEASSPCARTRRLPIRRRSATGKAPTITCSIIFAASLPWTTMWGASWRRWTS